MMSKGQNFFKYAFLTSVSLLSVFPLYYMFCGATNKSTRNPFFILSSVFVFQMAPIAEYAL